MRGTCEKFCPETERKMRIKEKLVHFYELHDDTKEPGILVKEFARSAAGVTAPKKQDLRTEKTLHHTIEYLFKNILTDKRRPYSFVYDFIFDRLRAVRQEIVIQEFDAKQTIPLLQPMILFLSYSRFNLCEEPIQTFDPKICEHHLQECLKRVLCCYDEIGVHNLKAHEVQQCILMESLYQIFNLGSTHTLHRGLSLPAEIRASALFQHAFSMSLNYFTGQFLSVIKALPLLPHILCALASLKLPQIRFKLLQLFTFAYNSKQLTVPVTFLNRCLGHACIKDTLAECKYYGLRIKDGEQILFSKSDFQKDKIYSLKKEHRAIEKFKSINLPELLLLNETTEVQLLPKLLNKLKI